MLASIVDQKHPRTRPRGGNDEIAPPPRRPFARRSACALRQRTRWRPRAERHADLRRRIARCPNPRSDPRNSPRQRSLSSRNVRQPRRLRSREGRGGAGRCRALGHVAGRAVLDLPFARRPDLPQRRSANRARREVQPRAPDVAEIAGGSRRLDAPLDQEHRRRRRLDGPRQHQRATARPARGAEPRCCAGRLDHAQEVLRGGRRGGVPQEAGRQRPVEVLAQRPGRQDRVRGCEPCALARPSALQDLAHPADPRGEHARRHGAHRRGRDRLDQPGDGAGRRARRPRGADRPRHHAGRVPVLRHMAPCR